MRYVLAFMCVLALGLMGCSETAGTGGSVGDGGAGGDGGAAGNGGQGGAVACVDNVCPCSEAGIRAAIAEGGGPFTFECDGPTTVVTEAEIVIDNDVVLDGGGNLTVSGAEERWPGGPEIHRVFGVWFGANVALDGIKVVLGSAAGFGVEGMGGGILVYGSDLTLRNSTVSSNRATESGGGIAVVLDATLTLIDSTVMGNYADRDVGGGVAYAFATVTLTNSTVSENRGAGIGPAWTFERDGIGGVLTLTNSTVSGHGAAAAIELDGSSLTLTNTTVSGGGIRGDAGDGTTTMTNSIISSSDGCGALVVSNGYNIESPGDTCGFDQLTDQVNVSADDLKLGELADNGGPTETHTLGEGSVAIDQVPAVDCVDAEGEPLTTDQRDVTRPQGSACDVGAVEMEVTP